MLITCGRLEDAQASSLKGCIELQHEAALHIVGLKREWDVMLRHAVTRCDRVHCAGSWILNYRDQTAFKTA